MYEEFWQMKSTKKKKSDVNILWNKISWKKEYNYVKK